MSLKGIDVSKWNSPINWDLVKGNIDFAILKLGNIGDDKKFWLDNTFEKNYAECKRLNIPIGVYLYCYCNSPETARVAGEQVRDYLNDKPLELPIYIDMEDNEIKVEGRNRLTDIVVAFNTEIERAGKWAGVYANLDWFNNYLNKDFIKKKYTTWIAHIDYTNNQDKYNGQYDMFQYSWKGRVNGISGNNGNVDMDILYRDLIAEISGNNNNNNSISNKKSNEEIADEVINGQWGNGEERKQRLINAGYDYNTIQSIVNQKLNYKPKTLQVGTRVKAIANGNGASDGSGRQATKNITGTITRIIANAKYPYLISNGDPIGWYKADALEVI